MTIRTFFYAVTLGFFALGGSSLSAGTLLRNDFESNVWSSKSAYTNNATVTAAVASGAYGTITTQGSSTPSQGLALTVNSSAASGAWTAGFTSGILSLTTTNGTITNLGLVTLSFSLSASQTRPILVRVESYTAGNVRSGGLTKLIYPATTNYWQRFALDLSTMSPDGAGTFDLKSPQIAVSFELDSAAGGDGWPNAAGLTVKVDNVNYATPKYYVATNGSNSNGGTNEATAFATANFAIGKVVPGDIIVMRGGTYTNSIGFGSTGIGAPDAWIVLKNYPGETPVIRYNAWGVISIYISGSGTPSQYIELRGLTVRGYASFDANGDRFLDPNSTNGIGQAQGGPNCAAVYINGRDSVQVPHDFRIADSVFEYNPGGGPGGNSIDRLLIENNICRYNCWWTIYGTSGISTGENRDFDASGETRIVIQNNQSYGNETIVPCVSVPPTRFSDGNGIILDIPKNYTGGTLVQNNLSYNNGGSGIHGLSRNNFRILHNTAYMNSASPVLQYGEIFVAYSTNVWMLNNVMVSPTNTTGNSSFNEPITSNSGNLAGTIFFQSNLYAGGDIAIPVATGFSGNTQADPQFISPSINPTNASFRLATTSPARSNAPALAYRSDYDLAGQPRPAGVSDQGAYQVQSTDCFPPMFAPLPGNFSAATNVTLTSGTPGATIIYTTNGTLPAVGSDGTITNGLAYAGAIPVSAATTIQAVAWKSGLVVSALTAGNYTFIDRSGIPIPNLFFTPFDVKPAGTTTIGIICKTPGALVRYTLDGSPPSPTFGTIMGSSLPALSANQILRALAYTPGRANSAIAEISGAGIYAGATPAAGTATNATALEVGARFRSSVNGTATELRVWRPAGGPTNYTATLWSSGGSSLGSVTINTTTDNAWSGVNLGTPVPIAANTTYVVSYTVAANGAYKSIPNGLSAGRTNGPVYFLPTTNGVFNLTAGAFPTSNGNGTDYCADVFLVTTPTAAPTFSPLPGNYLVPQSVTITSATPGAIIYYTTNNTAPTTNSPTLANGGTISIGTTANLQAFAVSANALNSVITSGVYQIGPGPVTETWNQTAAGTFSWNVNANWLSGTNFPKNPGDVANVNPNFSGAETINVSVPITLGTLNLGDPTSTFNALTLQTNGGSLIFDNAFLDAVLLRSATVNPGVNDTINLNVQLNSPLTVSFPWVNGQNGITLNGVVSGANGITVIERNLPSTGGNNNQVLTLANTNNSFTGDIELDNGQLQFKGSVLSGQNSALGNSTNAIAISGAGTLLQTGGYFPATGSLVGVPTTELRWLASGDTDNAVITRPIDFSGAGADGTYQQYGYGSLRMNGDGASGVNSNTLTVGGPVTLPAGSRRFWATAFYEGMTMYFTNNISSGLNINGAGQSSGIINWGGNNTGPGTAATDGAWFGAYRFSNLARTYTNSQVLQNGTVIIEGSVGAVGTASPVGTQTIGLTDGNSGNIIGGGSAANPGNRAQDEKRAIFLANPGTSFARDLVLGVGTVSANYNGGAFNLFNGYKFGGLNASGTITWSGSISGDASNGVSTANQTITVAQNVALIQATGGTANFTGVIYDTTNAATVTRVTVNQFRNHPNIDVDWNNTPDVGVANALVGTPTGGTVMLSNTNGYAGGTEILGGTLLVNNVNLTGSGTGTGSVLVQSNATLGGVGRIAGAVTFAAGSDAVFTNGAVLTLASSLIVSNGVDVHLNLSNNVPVGTNTLCTYNVSGSSGSFNTNPVIDSGSLAANTQATIVTGSGTVQLQIISTVPPAPPNFSSGAVSVLPSGNISLVATGAVGVPYRLWAGTNLSVTPVTNLWTLLNSGTITVSPFTNLDLTATNFPQRFYLFTTP